MITNKIGKVFLAVVCSASVQHMALAADRSQESICGSTADYQDVELYDGGLGISFTFLSSHQSEVGQLQWNSNIRRLYPEPGRVQNARVCSGTLIGPNLFLTAAHCIEPSSDSSVFPVDPMSGTVLTAEQAAANMHVNFQYQLDGSGNLRAEDEYAVTRLVELRRGNLDYAILELQGAPGHTYGYASLRGRLPSQSELLTIIQHPQGLPKVVATGNFVAHDNTRLFYGDLDTENGSSGSGVLDTRGRLIGVHTDGGCDEYGVNVGVSISAIAEQSPEISQIVNSCRSGATMSVQTRPGSVSHPYICGMDKFGQACPVDSVAALANHSYPVLRYTCL